MNTSISSHIETLRNLNLQLHHQLEQLEACVPDLNRAVEQLRTLGLLDDAMLLGDVIQQGSYDPRCGPHDSGWVLQAAFGIGGGGLGTVIWDSEAYVSFLRHGHVPPDIRAANFSPLEPLEETRPAVRGLMMPQVGPFVVEICRMAGVEI